MVKEIVADDVAENNLSKMKKRALRNKGVKKEEERNKRDSERLFSMKNNYQLSEKDKNKTDCVYVRKGVDIRILN